jgi:hypothetical protein
MKTKENSLKTNTTMNIIKIILFDRFVDFSSYITGNYMPQINKNYL